MQFIWSWISLRCRSLRWKIAVLFSLTVVLTSVVMFKQFRTLTIERVLEHEMVDLADDANGVVAELRRNLASAKETTVMLASKLATIEKTEWGRKFPELIMAPPIHCLRADFFVVTNDTKHIQGVISSNWNRELIAPGPDFPQAFAKSRVETAFSPPQKLHFVSRDEVEDKSRESLVVQVASRIPGANDASTRPFVVLTFELSGLNSVIPRPFSADFDQPILDQARSSPRGMLYVRGPDKQILFSPTSSEKLQSQQPGLPNAVFDGFHILEVAARFQKKQAGSIDDDIGRLQSDLAVTLKTKFAKSREKDFTASALVNIQKYGWTFDQPVRNDDNVLETPRFFAFTKTLTLTLAEKKRLEQELSNLRDKYPDAQFADPSASNPRVKIRAKNKEDLNAIRSSLSELSWEGEAVCRHYGIYFVRVPFDPVNDDKNVSSADFQSKAYLDFASAASLEEITSDVEAEIQARLRGNVWLVAAAILLAWWLSMAITTPLAKIDASTERIAAGDYNTPDLPVTDGSEIGALARSFKKMVVQIQERNAEIHEAELRIRSVVQQAAEGIIQCSATGEIQEINDAALQVFGYSLEELRHRPFDLLLQHVTDEDIPLPTAYVEVQNTTVSKLAETSASCSTIVGRRKDGSLFPLEVSVKQVKVSDRISMITIIARDITERKRMTRELQELNEQLELRVKRRTAELEFKQLDLEAARDQALEASRAKSAFLAQMSHELRTPLNSIIGYSELLIDDARDAGNESIVPDLRKIVDSGRHLLTLINDVLDLSKIEAGKMELCLEEFDIAEEVQSVQKTMEPLAVKNANTLHVECTTHGCRMYADRTRVRQVLFNLLSNAFKFTDHGKVDLEVTIDTARAICRFLIRDSGIGMSSEQIAKLFQQFSQADVTTTRKYGGTGLGLVISQRICRLMGGEIGVVSTLGGGSTFTVELPLRVFSPMQVDSPKMNFSEFEQLINKGDMPKSDTTGPTVLVIDDDPAVREVLERILVREGLRVVTAASGEAGIQAARDLNPAVITLDVMMPHMDGWEVLGRLKADLALRHIPVVILSIIDDKQFGFTLGATDYLTKPIDRNRLISVLRTYLPSGSPTVLIVEDDPNTREVLSRILASEGWKTVEAENGRVGLERLTQTQPSLILLDLIMPEMDGFQFLAALRQNPRWSGVPVLVLTAMEITTADREWLNGSVLQVLNKDCYTVEELITVVKRAIPAGRKIDNAETVTGGR